LDQGNGGDGQATLSTCEQSERIRHLDASIVRLFGE